MGAQETAHAEIKCTGEARVAFDGLCMMGISPFGSERLWIDRRR